MNGLTLIAALDNEDRQDEIVCGQSCFTHQATAELVATHATHAGSWELAGEACGIFGHFFESSRVEVKLVRGRFSEAL